MGAPARRDRLESEGNSGRHRPGTRLRRGHRRRRGNWLARRPTGWREAAADRYARIAKRAVASETWFARGLAAVRDAFLTLTEEGLAGEPPAALETSLIAALGSGPDARSKIDGILDGLRAPESWRATVVLLGHAWGARPGPDGPGLSLRDLSDLARRAPTGVRADLLGLYRTHLLPRFPVRLRDDPAEAARVARLLCDWLPEPPVAELLTALWEYAEEAEHGEDAGRREGLFRRFYLHGATIFQDLLAAAEKARVSIDPEVVLEAVSCIGRRARGTALVEEPHAAAGWLALLSRPRPGRRGGV